VERKTYSVVETAKVLGIGRSAAYQAVNAGEIPSIRIGGRLLVPVQALEQLLSSAKPSTPGTQISADQNTKSEALR
jgi:excisionase family DNA binding protein